MIEPLDLSSNYTSANYRYKEGGDGFAVENGKKVVDCSHMVNLLLKGAGYEVPYQNTAGLNSGAALQYYDVISPANVKRGDIVLWINATSNHENKTLNHTGIVEFYDSTLDSEFGKFFGAQSSGPATAPFGALGKAWYWPVPTKFLRVKESTRTGGNPAPTPAPAPAPAASPLMNFQYPFRKADGKQFTDAGEVYKALEGEKSGHYLLGSNKFWHGGIHISDASAPQCVLNEPIRCMADGEVVAYRLNEDYLESTFGDNEKKLKYSNSFCLVRHEYKSAPNPEEGPNKGKQNKLNFYSLYMHLLPYMRYPLSEEETPKPKVTMTVNDFKAYDEFPESSSVQSPGKLSTGTKLEVLEQRGVENVTYAKGKILSGSVKNGSHKVRGVGKEVWFAYLKDGAPYQNSKPQRIWRKDDVPERAKPKYWQGKVKAKTCQRLAMYAAPANPTSGQPAGARIEENREITVNSTIAFDSKDVVNLVLDNKLRRMAPCTPVEASIWQGTGSVPSNFWAIIESDPESQYVQWETVTPTNFDVVSTSIGIKAGDPIGYFGKTENLLDESGVTESKFQVHIEIFTPEADIKDFLDNLARLKIGKQYLHLPIGTKLKNKAPASGTTDPLKKEHAIDLGKALIIREGTEDWYEVCVVGEDLPISGLIKKSDAVIITQHDWTKLGFHVVEESNANADGFLDPEDMPDFFKDLFKKIDKNGNGDVDPSELADALKNTDTRDQWSKLIARHPTEWKEEAKSPKWARLDKLLEDTPKLLKHEKDRIDAYIFWGEVQEKAHLGSNVIWHFHPIEMLRNFLSQSAYIDADRFVAMYSERHSTFQVGAPAFSAKSKQNLMEIIVQINSYVDKKKLVLTRYELAYMFATARHEAYNFQIGEFFSSAPEIGPVSYFNKYDPVLASSAASRDNAISYENTVEGDGYKYRGRGLVHLTWKKNYRKATEYFGIDFVSNPEAAAEFKNSIPIMIWGMKEGIFSGAKIGTYISNSGKDYIGARMVINGVDDKELIAGYAEKFEEILKETSIAPEKN